MAHVEKLGRILLVMEAEVPKDGKGKWVRLCTSIPGREGAKSRVWDTPSGVMDGPTFEEFAHHIIAELVEAMVSVGGIRQVVL